MEQALRPFIQMLGKNEALDDVVVYWGGRTKQDLYALDKIEALKDKFPNLRFIPVLSEPLSEDEWNGRVGFVHQAVLDDYEDLASYEVYACGSPLMVNAARGDFQKLRNLAIENFYSDAFA